MKLNQRRLLGRVTCRTPATLTAVVQKVDLKLIPFQDKSAKICVYLAEVCWVHMHQQSLFSTLDCKNVITALNLYQRKDAVTPC